MRKESEAAMEQVVDVPVANGRLGCFVMADAEVVPDLGESLSLAV
jgi:hypothetical protein